MPRKLNFQPHKYIEFQYNEPVVAGSWEGLRGRHRGGGSHHPREAPADILGPLRRSSHRSLGQGRSSGQRESAGQSGTGGNCSRQVIMITHKSLSFIHG